MIPFEKKYVKLCNGERIAYIEGGEGDKTLLCIHGNMASCLFMYEFINNAPEGYRVICPDLNGFGDSSYLNPVSEMADLAENIHAFMTKLKQTKFAVLGWSLGGGVAMELAANYPESVTHLIMCSGTPANGFPLLKKTADGLQPYASKDEMKSDPMVFYNLQALAAKDATYFKNAFNMVIYSLKKPPENIYDFLMTETLKQANLVDVDWALAVLNITDEPNAYGAGTGKIHKIACPVLITAGANDLMVPAALVARNVAIFGDRAKLITYANAAHAQWVDDPERFFADLADFLNA
ncbi:MAG: alpha/beta hydrolase [Clostridia bacterium]|nr:alpha/beta hydrolase [Clostridia bacterium]